MKLNYAMSTYHIAGVSRYSGSVCLGLAITGRVGRRRGEEITPVRDVGTACATAATAQFVYSTAIAGLGLVR